MPGDERPQDSEHARLIDVSEAIAPRDLLEHGDITPLGFLRGASNAALLCRVELDDRSALAVAKPAAGESPLWDFPEGTLYLREIAASVLADALGWPEVPTTVARELPESEFGIAGATSLQAFIPHDPNHHAFTLEARHESALREVALFDVIANNADRKGGHVLLDEHDQLWAIDHGICFAASAKLRTVLWLFAGDPIDEQVISSLAQVAETPAFAKLADLLVPEEVAALRARIADVVATQRFPEQPRLRPSVPFPPI